MSGRGKGGKGLGKGGAKRHRKVLRDNIQGELACGACSPVLSSQRWRLLSCPPEGVHTTAACLLPATLLCTLTPAVCVCTLR